MASSTPLRPHLGAQPPSRRLPRQPKPQDPAALRARWRIEMNAARDADRAGDHSEGWRRLQRAHILSQPLTSAHIRTHARMLRFALHAHDRRESLGQIVRLVAAGVGSVSGRYPLGNTGGADVSALQPMEIPNDLRPFLVAR